MRISDWSSDVCSSDLLEIADLLLLGQYRVANLSIIGHRRLQAGNISGAVQTVDQRFHSIEAQQFLHDPRQGRIGLLVGVLIAFEKASESGLGEIAWFAEEAGLFRSSDRSAAALDGGDAARRRSAERGVGNEGGGTVKTRGS